MKYFGTDGIRGEVNKELTSDLVLKLGRSINALSFNKVLIGYDTRNSSTLIKFALSVGLLERGKEIIDVGIITTSGLLYLSKIHSCLGIMITASHNMNKDNGIKIFINGEKINANEENIIEERMDKEEFEYKGIGKYYYLDLINEYRDYLVSRIKKNNLRIGLDFANGSLFRLGKDIFSLISDFTYYTGDKANGDNINNECGSTYIESIRQLVLKNNLDIGFSFDGDADRIIVSDKNGNIYNGEALIFIFAKYLKKHNKLKNNAVVLTEVTNLGVINSFIKEGIDVYLSSVGDKNVSLMMKEKDVIIGGEESGHIINLDSFFVGEGITNAMYLLNILDEEKRSLKELTSSLDYYYETRLSFKVLNKGIVDDKKIKEYILNQENEHKNKLKIVLRKSGTENVIRLFISSLNNDLLNNVRKEITTLINSLDIDFKQKVNYFPKNYDNVIVSKEAKIEEGVTLLPFSVINGKSIIRKGSVIGPNTEINNSIIGFNSIIKHSVIEDSSIGNNVSIGPFAHLRNNAEIKDYVHIGNFVEVKKSLVGSYTKASHLAYIGDTECGSYVNWGCGSISVNFDGKEKHKTLIGNHVFIGCNANLIAPIEIGNNAFIAAGTTLTHNVPSSSFSIARSRQITKVHYFENKNGDNK